jgi:two-component system nitrate/nitrite sensor histidine kinase NarX
MARELHDSIAQSLAFLKIQVQLMQEALDHQNLVQAQARAARDRCRRARELRRRARTAGALPHPRQFGGHRAGAADHLAQVRAADRHASHATNGRQRLPLAPDRQIQVLHILQEALSNVRKHAGATQVWLDVQQQPQWRFEVRDNGHGFDAQQGQDETHVGLRIMTERAQRIGGHLEVLSRPGHGTSVLLTLAPEAAGTPPLPAAEAVASS